MQNLKFLKIRRLDSRSDLSFFRTRGFFSSRFMNDVKDKDIREVSRIVDGYSYRDKLGDGDYLVLTLLNLKDRYVSEYMFKAEGEVNVGELITMLTNCKVDCSDDVVYKLVMFRLK